MRRIHDGIHGEWCVGPAPDHPGLADPFRWTITEYSEGAETSESLNPYPAVDLEPVVIEFRRFSVEYFGLYILQKPRVEEAWENYNRKLLECAALEETWTLKVDDCDELQIAVHDQACMHAASNRQCASNFGHEYHMTMVAYNAAVATIQQLEADRKREWETLKIVTCLLETVYTHVIHSIDSGEPCPTTESHPEQTEQEIQYCHVVEESLTANLTIDYGNPPPPPALPPVIPPPCTAEYIWEEHGSFPFEVQASHSETIQNEGLEAYFTVLSAYGWAGCAAPRACTPCESTDLLVDPAYTANDVCKEHHQHLRPGQLDFDTFKCLSGDQCIRSDGRCNGVANCDDASDEQACETNWGVPAVLHNEECQDPFISDIQFQCADGTCTHIHGKCNGINNCADGSDELNCATTTHHLTLEATTGYTASIETPVEGASVFYDREYTFVSLGDFAGQTYIKSSNEDKHIRHSHVQMKLRFDQPTTVYVVALQELPWLQAEGWTTSALEGPIYRGVRQTRHTDWSGELVEDTYGPGRVFEKTFPSGTVEMRGNGAGDGTFLIFVANPGGIEEPVVCCLALEAGCLACAARLTVEEYCMQNPTTVGCPVVAPDTPATLMSDMSNGGTCEVSQTDPHWIQSTCRSMFDGNDVWGNGPGLHLRNGATLERTFAQPILIDSIDLKQIWESRYGSNYWRGDLTIETFDNGAWTRQGRIDDLPVAELQNMMEGAGNFKFRMAAPVRASRVRLIGGNPTRGNGEIFRLVELRVMGWIQAQHPVGRGGCWTDAEGNMICG